MNSQLSILIALLAATPILYVLMALVTDGTGPEGCRSALYRAGRGTPLRSTLQVLCTRALVVRDRQKIDTAAIARTASQLSGDVIRLSIDSRKMRRQLIQCCAIFGGMIAAGVVLFIWDARPVGACSFSIGIVFLSVYLAQWLKTRNKYPEGSVLAIGVNDFAIEVPNYPRLLIPFTFVADVSFQSAGRAERLLIARLTTDAFGVSPELATHPWLGSALVWRHLSPCLILPDLFEGCSYGDLMGSLVTRVTKARDNGKASGRQASRE